MTEQEFISHWVGTPWLERGRSKDGIDCWALVVRYYKDVLGIELEELRKWLLRRYERRNAATLPG